MAKYSWRGTDARGREQQGECSATGISAAATELRSRGLAPLSMERIDADPIPKLSVSADAFTLFNRNLAEMTAVGLPLPQAVREIAAGLRSGRFKRGLEQVEAALRDGKTLAEAAAAAPGVFPPYYEAMLKAGAASGNLPAMFSVVARNAEGLRLARRALIEALSYPLLIISFTVLLAGATLGILAPFYREFSSARGFEAPGLEPVLRVFGSHALLVGVGAGILALGAALICFLSRTVAGDRILNALPLVGRIRRHLMMARLLGALGVMLRAGVPLPRALLVAIGAAGSRELDRAAEPLVAAAAEGLGLGGVLARAPVVPPDVAGFLALSERTGDAPGAALNVAQVLTEQALSESELLFVVLLPMALAAAGLVVLAFVTSVVMPYQQFLESIHP
jgi:type II secretory pathway component PulF